MSRFTFHIGGVHPDDNKRAADCPIEVLPLPKTMYVALSQHVGAPAVPVVAAGDKVLAGQVIAEPAGPISSFIHSPVSGTVKAIAPRKDLGGKSVPHIEIEVEGDEWAEGIDTGDSFIAQLPTDREATLAKIRKAGVVGLGGAAFPTTVKLSPPAGSKVEFLLINGSECEPWLTSDYRMMIEHPREILTGVAILRMVLGGCPAYVGIEENKPAAIKAMKEALSGLGLQGIEIKTLRKKYPQGGEKQLIVALTGRQVASGALPISVGAVVQNVMTSFAVYEAVQKNKPLISNVLTVTGDCLEKERMHNYLFRIGTPMSFIAEYAGGIPEQAAKIVSGGPMMGRAIVNMDAATVKSSSSILYLRKESTARKEESNCIRCGRCSDACPMGLEPFNLIRLVRSGADMDVLEKNGARDCIMCGCCLYSCPANLPLLDYIRLVRGQVKVNINARKK